MLIIELDGPIHNSQKEYDKRRDEILISKGYRILRIENDELENIDLVLEKIKSQFINHTPPFSKGGARGGL
jgi:very-short-patch-repair endonuclease